MAEETKVEETKVIEEAKKDVKEITETVKDTYKSVMTGVVGIRDEGLKLFDVITLLVKKIGVAGIGVGLLALALDIPLSAAGVDIGVLDTLTGKLAAVGVENVWAQAGIVLAGSWAYLKINKNK